jgi:lipopolysaccharide/colanic/teichoic acid biosynthesis glycosyltransferase
MNAPTITPAAASESVSAPVAGGRQSAVATTATPPARSGLSAEAFRLRAFDLVVTVAILPFALVIGAIVSILIVLDSPGPVLYRATRVGRSGKTFRMLKFRKMRRCATGSPLTMDCDERFTPIGRFLALTKLDELPQLYNVLRGDMRLVGPRPEDVSFVERYREHYDEILSVVPGITGPAAVQYASESRMLAGHEDPVAFYAEHLMPLKIEIDIEYVRNRSVTRDMRILLTTLAVPVSRILRRVGQRRNTRVHHHTLILFIGCTLLFALSAVAAGV